jgi:hypothetical protein
MPTCLIPSGKLMGMDTEPTLVHHFFPLLESRHGTAEQRSILNVGVQELEWRKGHSLIGQLIAAGEFPSGEMQAAWSAPGQGAPVDWVALDGVMLINVASKDRCRTNTHAVVFTTTFFFAPEWRS